MGTTGKTDSGVSPLSLDELRRFVRLCDPQRPLEADDPVYVAFDEGIPTRGTTHASAIQALRRFIYLKDESCQLFTGFPGTGKTTELRRLRAQLSAARDLPTHAVYIDFEEYLDRYTPASITDILRIVAYSLDRAATIAEGKDPNAEPGYVRRLFDFLVLTDVTLKKLDFHVVGATLMLELKNNPSFRQQVEETLSGRFQQFAAEALHTMTEAVVRLRKAPESTAERVVVIADGLEKFSPLREEDRDAMEASVESLFVQHARLLRLPCHVIYTFPIWLRFRVAELGSLYDSQPLVLPMVKIAERDGRAYEAGIEKLRELVRKRIDEQHVFGKSGAVLTDLVLASGGYPRDLLRMVREVLVRGESFPVSSLTANRVIDDLAREYAVVVRGTHVPMLEQLSATHTLPQADSNEVASFGRLLEKWLVLAYRDETEWYDLHPLVRRSPLVAAALRGAGHGAER
jgi:hypothetical protein